MHGGRWGRDLSQSDAILPFKANRKKKKKRKKKKEKKKSLIARTMAVSFKPSRDKRLCTTRRVDLNRGDPIVPFGDRIDLGLVFFNCNQLFDEEEKTFIFFLFFLSKTCPFKISIQRTISSSRISVISRKKKFPPIREWFFNELETLFAFFRNIY